MLVLKEKEVCPYMSRCPYAENCQGTNSNRNEIFNCDFVLNEKIESGHFRNKLDKTGRMKIITE